MTLRAVAAIRTAGLQDVMTQQAPRQARPDKVISRASDAGAHVLLNSQPNQVISEQRQQIAELAASAAAHEKIPPSMCIAALGMWSAWGLKTTSAMRAVNNVAEIRLLRGIRLRMSVSPWEADAKIQQQKSIVQGMRD